MFVELAFGKMYILNCLTVKTTSGSCFRTSHLQVSILTSGPEYDSELRYHPFGHGWEILANLPESEINCFNFNILVNFTWSSVKKWKLKRHSIPFKFTRTTCECNSLDTWTLSIGPTRPKTSLTHRWNWCWFTLWN